MGSLKAAKIPFQDYGLHMSWSKENLARLYKNAFDPTILSEHSRLGSLTLYQQKHRAKRLVRAYHGDWLQERVWTRQLLNTDLRTGTFKAVIPYTSSTVSSGAQSGRQGMQRTDNGTTVTGSDAKATPILRIPVGALMFRNLERRLDVVVFRSCFASSIEMARQLVLQGKVKLNTQVMRAPGTILSPGDLVSVEPTEIPMLKPRRPPGFSSQQKEKGSTSSGEAIQRESPAESGETELKPTSHHDPRFPLHFRLPDYASPHLFIPPYLEPSFRTCSVVYVRHPIAGPGFNEIPTPFDADGDIIRLAFERYARGRFSRPQRQLRL